MLLAVVCVKWVLQMYDARNCTVSCAGSVCSMHDFVVDMRITGAERTATPVRKKLMTAESTRGGSCLWEWICGCKVGAY